MHHSQEEILRILTTDYSRNHAGREYSCAWVIEVMEKWIAGGGYLYCAPNVMFIGEAEGDTFEFHSVNGGGGRDITEGINLLLASLAPHYQFAITFYDNPKINDLAKFINFPTTVTRIDEGQDRTFSMHFDLRS